MTATVDTDQLEAKVKDMYRHVAQQPDGPFHFELGEQVALRVGYAADRLTTVPPDALEVVRRRRLLLRPRLPGCRRNRRRPRQRIRNGRVLRREPRWSHRSGHRH